LRRSIAAVFFAALTIAALATSRAAEVPIPPAPTQWVTDNAGALSAQTRDSLNTQLKEYQQSTGHQLIVWIDQTTGDAALEDWTIRAFTAWKVGRKGLDDGLVLFIFMQDRKVRIEVGYGLEGQVTDAAASNIARNVIVPKMRAGDVDGAVTDGVNALIAVIGGQAQPDQYAQPQPGEQAGPLALIFGLFGPLVFVFIVFLIIIRMARYASGRGYTIGSGGSGTGWWLGSGGDGYSGGDSGGGGGGFSGGGGMGGGGGASAGW